MLRWRLLAGFLALLLLLLGVGGYAVWLMHNLGRTEHVILTGETTRILEVRNLERVAQQQERLLHAHLQSPGESGEPLREWQQGRENIDAAVARLEAEARLSRESGEVLANLLHQVEALRTVYGRVESNWGTRDRLVEELPELHRLGQGLSAAAERVVNASEARLVQADDGTDRLRRDSTRFMLAALAVAVGIFAYTAFVIGRAVITPIRDMTHCIREIASGHLDQKLEISSNDELREMAEAFNAMAGELRAHRKKSTDELLRAHQLLQTTLATFPDPIFVLPEPTRIAFHNPAGQRLLTELDLLAELPAAVKRRLDRVFATGQDFYPTTLTEANYFRINDQAHYFLTRILAMRRDDGMISGVIVAMQDVTRLRLMDELKTNHMATLSHELKTPLTSLQLALELLGEDRSNTLSPRQREIVASARSDSERLVSRLHDILDLSKFQNSTQATPKKTPGNLPPDSQRRPSLARRLTTRIISIRDSERG